MTQVDDSAVEADLQQLNVIFALHKRMNPAIDTGLASQPRQERPNIRSFQL